jgi:hypothetical protein
MRPLLPLALLLTAFDFTPPHRNLASPTPVFHPEEFFIGKTEGKGIIKGPVGRRTALAVQSVGRIEQDGTLVLEQRVQREGSPPDRRTWRMRKTGANRYGGTISDAKGPVHIEIKGNCLHIRYTIAKGNLAADQYIYLQPGGRSAVNRMVVRKFGLSVASVEEVVRKVG